MLSNPPYGKAWNVAAEKMGGKKEILDSRFVTSFRGDPKFSMIPRVSDGQTLFLLNNISKMKRGTELGSRIAEVHNGSSHVFWMGTATSWRSSQLVLNR